MQFQRIGVFITTDGGPIDPPANPPEPLRKVVVPVGSNTSVPFDFAKTVEGAWFTPVDGLANIARFNQLFTGRPNGNHVDLIVSARERGASLIGFLNALI